MFIVLSIDYTASKSEQHHTHILKPYIENGARENSFKLFAVKISDIFLYYKEPVVSVLEDKPYYTRNVSQTMEDCALTKL